MRVILCLFASLVFCLPAAAEDEPAGPPPGGPGAGPGGERDPGDGPGGRGGMRRGPSFDRLLQRFDENDDGKIDRAEVEGTRAERMFDRFDRDGDGVLTQKDFEGRGGPEGRGERGERRGPGGTSTLSPQQLDTNRDNKISAAEWKAFHEKADQNGDGIVDKAEWDATVTGGRLRDKAPSVGSPAPKVSATRMGFDEVVDLAKPKRTTVLIFGSHT